MSSFMQEASHISFMQRHATHHSLCLIDEFGKGTTSDDGVSLLTSTLTHWQRTPNTCPLVLATTHFHEMFTYDLLLRSPILRPYTMSFIQDSASPEPTLPSSPSSTLTLHLTVHPPATIIPLFTLQAGLCSDSYALSCARAAGLPSALLDRASVLMRAFERGSRVDGWSWVKEERKSKEEEGGRKIVREFERLVKQGLEAVDPLELTGLIEMLQAENEWIAEERRMRVEEQVNAGSTCN